MLVVRKIFVFNFEHTKANENIMFRRQFTIELNPKKIFLTMYIVNPNLPEGRVQVLPSKKKLSELPDDGPNIFKKSNIERYAERPSATSCNGKYIVLSMLHANKPGDISQRNKLDDHQE